MVLSVPSRCDLCRGVQACCRPDKFLGSFVAKSPGPVREARGARRCEQSRNGYVTAMSDEHTQAPDGPDPRHQVPDGVDEATVEAVGKLTEALETTERARGHLYSFHQLTGSADLELGEAVEMLRKAGHADLAASVEEELVGRNVLPGRWTFQVVEEYDDTYWSVFRETERRVRELLTDGRRHLFEAGMKEDRRTHGHPGHAARP